MILLLPSSIREKAAAGRNTKGESIMNERITIGEKYRPAMEINSQAEADAYFERCVQHTLSFRPDTTRADAESIERQNLGYFAGYYGSETRERVERLFKCSHPIFGKIAENGVPSPEQAFEAGKQFATARRRT